MARICAEMHSPQRLNPITSLKTNFWFVQYSTCYASRYSNHICLHCSSMFLNSCSTTSLGWMKFFNSLLAAVTEQQMILIFPKRPSTHGRIGPQWISRGSLYGKLQGHTEYICVFSLIMSVLGWMRSRLTHCRTLHWQHTACAEHYVVIVLHSLSPTKTTWHYVSG